MKTLEQILKDAAAGLAGPTVIEVAQAGKELLAKQVRASWAERTDPDGNAWAGTKQGSFAGIARTFAGGGNVYAYKAGEGYVFYNKRKRHQYRAENQEQYHPTDSHLAHMAIRAIRNSAVTEKGFTVDQRLPKYGYWQDEGTTKTGWGGPIPAREFWAFGDDLLDTVNGLLADKGLRAVVGS